MYRYEYTSIGSGRNWGGKTVECGHTCDFEDAISSNVALEIIHHSIMKGYKNALVLSIEPVFSLQSDWVQPERVTTHYRMPPARSLFIFDHSKP
jgi:hypothetical protein